MDEANVLMDNCVDVPNFSPSYRFHENKPKKTRMNQPIPTTIVCVFNTCSDSCSCVVVTTPLKNTGTTGRHTSALANMFLHHQEDRHTHTHTLLPSTTIYSPNMYQSTPEYTVWSPPKCLVCSGAPSHPTLLLDLLLYINVDLTWCWERQTVERWENERGFSIVKKRID